MIAPRPELAEVTVVPHGSTHRTDLADFSSSVIPLDVPLEKLLQETRIFCYPDTTSHEFRSTVARATGLGIENVIAGNGASEIFFMVGMAFIRKGDAAGFLKPTFGEYGRVARIMGASLHEFALEADEGFFVCPEKLGRWIHDRKINHFTLCNPNNPTGRFMPFAAVVSLLDAHPDCLFVVDLAYFDYVGTSIPYAELVARPNCILVHSLTKAFGIAGLRSGYAIAGEPLVSALEKVRVPWNMNALAQTASAWLLENRHLYAPVIERYRREAERMAARLAAAGFRTVPSETDYFMLEVPCSQGFKAALLEKGFLVRELASMGCPCHVRINVCDPALNEGFVEAVRSL